MWINATRKWGIILSVRQEYREKEINFFFYHPVKKYQNQNVNSVSDSVFSLLKLTWTTRSKKFPLKLIYMF